VALDSGRTAGGNNLGTAPLPVGRLLTVCDLTACLRGFE
jgi:hypothetical protein